MKRIPGLLILVLAVIGIFSLLRYFMEIEGVVIAAFAVTSIAVVTSLYLLHERK
jgi:hypothetical protein